MKSPLELASRCLADIEDRWIPYSALWWRIWTPPIARDERYLEGYFQGYDDNDGDDEDETESTYSAALRRLPALDIRRMLAMPFVRKLYKKLPYIDVVPVERPWDMMDAAQRAEREKFVIESTRAAYAAGRALYPRGTIKSIEEQLRAAGERSERRNRGRGAWRRFRRRLCEGCEAPQTAWVRFRTFDGVMQCTSTWAPGAEQVLFGGGEEDGEDGEEEGGNSVYVPGRSQIEFRTIQELTMPDPDAWSDPFVPDGWQTSVGYSPINVVPRVLHESSVNSLYGVEEGRMTTEELTERLERERAVVRAAPEWKAFEAEAGIRGVLQSVDKIVFFYMSGLTDAGIPGMFVFALVARLRDHIQGLRKGSGPRIPIYMPAHDLRRTWDGAEREFFEEKNVVLIESNGELFLKVDERTAVVSYLNRNPVKQVVADFAKPAVLVCTTVSEDADQDFAWIDEDRDGETVKVPRVRAPYVDSEVMMTDPDSPRVRRLVKDYDHYALPELPGTVPDSDKKGISMYVRRPGVCTKVDYW